MIIYTHEGKFLGVVSSFGDARRLHEQYLQDKFPTLYANYAGVSTAGSTFGHPLFQRGAVT